MKPVHIPYSLENRIVHVVRLLAELMREFMIGLYRCVDYKGYGIGLDCTIPPNPDYGPDWIVAFDCWHIIFIKHVLMCCWTGILQRTYWYCKDLDTSVYSVVRVDLQVWGMGLSAFYQPFLTWAISKILLLCAQKRVEIPWQSGLWLMEIMADRLLLIRRAAGSIWSEQRSVEEIEKQ